MCALFVWKGGGVARWKVEEKVIFFPADNEQYRMERDIRERLLYNNHAHNFSTAALLLDENYGLKVFGI